MAGNTINDPNYYRRNDGTSIEECLAIGGDWSNVGIAFSYPGDRAAFVELHVE